MPKPLWEKNYMCVRNWWDKVFEGFINGQPHLPGIYHRELSFTSDLWGKSPSTLTFQLNIPFHVHRDQGFLWLFPHSFFSVHKAGWMTVRMRKNREVCTEQPHQSPYTRPRESTEQPHQFPTLLMRQRCGGLDLRSVPHSGVGSSAVCFADQKHPGSKGSVYMIDIISSSLVGHVLLYNPLPHPSASEWRAVNTVKADL